MALLNPLASDLEMIFSRTEAHWAELSGKRIFITGGTGFFGTWLLESFAWINDRMNLGAEAIVLSRNPAGFKEKIPHLAQNRAIQFHRGDVRDFEFPAGEFSHVIHGATEASAKLNSEQPLLMLDTIVDGTRHVLEFARHCGASKFLFTSSGAVYGRQPPELTHIPENHPGGPDPTNPHYAYAEGKRIAELLCTLYLKQFGLETKIARCFAFVGPHLPLNVHLAIGNFIRNAMSGEPIQINGDGTPFRSYLYSADLMVWLWTLLFRGHPGRAYNVGSGEAYSIRQVAELVQKNINPNLKIHIAREPDGGTLPERYVPDISLAQKDLGLCVTTGIDEAIQRTWKWNGKD